MRSKGVSLRAIGRIVQRNVSTKRIASIGSGRRSKLREGTPLYRKQRLRLSRQALRLAEDLRPQPP